MKRAGLQAGLVCGLLFLTIGCASTDIAGLLFLNESPGGGDRVVAGSVQAVAYNTQESMRGLGLKAVLTQQGEAFHIQSQSPDGSKFKVVLTRMQNGQGERTRVQVVWDGKTDSKTHAKIMATVAQ